MVSPVSVSAAPKSAFDTFHEPRYGRLRHLVIDSPPILASSEQATVLHHPQMLGSDMALDATSLGKFSNREFLTEHQLHHPQPHGVRQCSQALGGLPKMIQVDRFRSASYFHVSIISQYIDMSIYCP
jgi:hypothetical protein